MLCTFLLVTSSLSRWETWTGIALQSRSSPVASVRPWPCFCSGPSSLGAACASEGSCWAEGLLPHWSRESQAFEARKRHLGTINLRTRKQFWKNWQQQQQQHHVSVKQTQDRTSSSNSINSRGKLKRPDETVSPLLFLLLSAYLLFPRRNRIGNEILFLDWDGWSWDAHLVRLFLRLGRRCFASTRKNVFLLAVDVRAFRCRRVWLQSRSVLCSFLSSLLLLLPILELSKLPWLEDARLKANKKVWGKKKKNQRWVSLLFFPLAQAPSKRVSTLKQDRTQLTLPPCQINLFSFAKSISCLSTCITVRISSNLFSKRSVSFCKSLERPV